MATGRLVDRRHLNGIINCVAGDRCEGRAGDSESWDEKHVEHDVHDRADDSGGQLHARVVDRPNYIAVQADDRAEKEAENEHAQRGGRGRVTSIAIYRNR